MSGLSEDPRLRRREIVALSVFGSILLLGILFHRDLSRRHLAWKVASGVGGLKRIEEAARRGPEMLPYLEGYLHSDDGDTRWRVALAVKAMHHSACLPTFQKMIRSQDLRIRLNGLDGLSELVQLNVFPFLVAALRDPSMEIRRRAARSLEDLSGETFGYDPLASDEEREAATKEWEGWLEGLEEKRMGEQGDDEEK